MTRYFEESPGVKSFGRLIVFFCFLLGAILALSGVCLAAFAGLDPSVATAAVFGGCGIIGGGELLKGISKKHENHS